MTRETRRARILRHERPISWASLEAAELLTIIYLHIQLSMSSHIPRDVDARGSTPCRQQPLFGLKSRVVDKERAQGSVLDEYRQRVSFTSFVPSVNGGPQVRETTSALLRHRP